MLLRSRWIADIEALEFFDWSADALATIASHPLTLQ
jgi:hypothetical protein